MAFHRGLFGAIGSGISAVGGFLGDVASGAGGVLGDIFQGGRQQFQQPGFQAPTGTGIAERLGGLVGGLAEVAVPFLFPTREPKICGIVGPCRTISEVTGFPEGVPLPRTSRTLTLPSIPQAPGTIGAIPIGPTIAPSLPIPIGPATIRAGLGLPEGVEPMAAALALPGGAAILRQLPGILGGLAGGELIEQGLGLFGGPSLPAGGAIFRQTAAGVRARSLVRLTNPVTGNDVWYRNVGRPILFAGDFRTVKRVRKIASMARRRSGGR